MVDATKSPPPPRRTSKAGTREVNRDKDSILKLSPTTMRVGSKTYTIREGKDGMFIVSGKKASSHLVNQFPNLKVPEPAKRPAVNGISSARVMEAVLQRMKVE